MAREDWRTAALVGGLAVAGLAAAVVIAKAKEEVVAPPPEEVVPPPEMPPLPGIPALMFYENSPVTVKQVYRVYYYWGPWGTICVGVSPDPDWVYEVLRLRVVDAAGRGVPDVPVLVWTSDVPDSEGGSVNVWGQVHTGRNPVEMVTDADGIIEVGVGYRHSLDDVSRCHCGVKAGFCQIIPGVPPICLTTKCLTKPVVNSVYARIKGTAITTLGQAITSMESHLKIW